MDNDSIEFEDQLRMEGDALTDEPLGEVDAQEVAEPMDTGATQTVADVLGGQMDNGDRMDTSGSSDEGHVEPAPIAIDPDSTPIDNNHEGVAGMAQTRGAHIVTENEILDNTESDICKLRRRRSMEGASTTDDDFAKAFDECHDAASIDFQQFRDAQPAVADDTASDKDIITTVADMIRGIVHRQEDWSAEKKKSDRTNRLLAAALMLYRTRLVDLYIREQVLILWIIDGGVRLRVHSGICYLYGHKGSFDTYKGFPSEHIFQRIKAFLLVLEGMFRLLPSQTQGLMTVCGMPWLQRWMNVNRSRHGIRSVLMQLYFLLGVGSEQVLGRVVKMMPLQCTGTYSQQKASVWLD